MIINFGMQKAYTFRLFWSYAEFSISCENRVKNRYAKSRKKLYNYGVNYIKIYYINYIIHYF
jgi:hypothetical protein